MDTINWMNNSEAQNGPSGSDTKPIEHWRTGVPKPCQEKGSRIVGQLLCFSLNPFVFFKRS